MNMSVVVEIIEKIVYEDVLRLLPTVLKNVRLFEIH